MLLLGMMATIRCQVSVVYFYESMTKEHYSFMYSFIAMLEGFIGLGSALYFNFIATNTVSG